MQVAEQTRTKSGKETVAFPNSEAADFFVLLDVLTIDEIYIDAIGFDACVNKLFECGVHHVGDLVQFNDTLLSDLLRLTRVEISGIVSILESSDLTLGMSVPSWVDYRFKVPKFSRLVRRDHSNLRQLPSYQVI